MIVLFPRTRYIYTLLFWVFSSRRVGGGGIVAARHNTSHRYTAYRRVTSIRPDCITGDRNETAANETIPWKKKAAREGSKNRRANSRRREAPPMLFITTFRSGGSSLCRDFSIDGSWAVCFLRQECYDHLFFSSSSSDLVFSRFYLSIPFGITHSHRTGRRRWSCMHYIFSLSDYLSMELRATTRAFR